MSILNNSLLLTAPAGGDATAGRSIRLNASDSAYLSRTPASAGNQKTWTFSCWVKRSKNNGDRQGIFITTNAGGTTFFGIEFDASDKLTVYDSSVGGAKVSRITSAVYRDFSAWYHLVLVCNTPSATANERVRLYVNGSEVTQFSTTVNPTQNADLEINKAQQHSIGSWQPAAGLYLDGYLALVHFIDGQALTPSSFGETSATTGRWEAKTYAGTYGTNGFFLDFADNSTAAALGYDAAGSNDWTVNNLSVTAGSGNDSLRDHPTSAGTSTGLGGEVSGNYCTLNPLDAHSSITLAQGNLYAAGTVTGFRSVKSTIAIPSSGKWYFEGSTNDYNALLGVATAAEDNASYVGATTDGWSFQSGGYYNGSFTSGVSFSSGDILNFAVDRNNQKIWFGVNGTWVGSGNPATGANATFTNLPAGSQLFGMFTVSASAKTIDVNFGQRAWSYTAPSGFSPLVDTLLPTPTIAKPNTVMDVLLWTGTSSASNRTLTGLNFSPDLVWGKARSVAYGHRLYDSVRGAGNNKDLNSASTGAEGAGTDDQYGYISSFDSAGFSTTAGTADNDQWNSTNQTFAAWCWDAGSSNATNTSGTITSTVRANISAGFSVVTYTGTASNRTVGHGLGVAISLIIVKNRSSAVNWRVYHSALGGNKAIFLNTTDAADTWADYWNNTAPTSTTFSIGPESGVNGSGNNMVAYCWAPVAGYSAFGSYTGNGSSDGPFVYTGFRSRWIMVKRTDSAGDWVLFDTARTSYNPLNENLRANTSGAEGTAAVPPWDVTATGLKLRAPVANWPELNTSGGTYIYACFAEAPLAYARAR